MMYVRVIEESNEGKICVPWYAFVFLTPLSRLMTHVYPLLLE
jgi:hypothetical protein